MTLIDEVEQKGTNIRFYNGVDFDILIKHSKDGSEGFIYCFMDSWIKEVQQYNRDNKIKSVINNTEYSDFDWDNIDNNYICIYQADGIGIDILYQAIREKVINNYKPTAPYLHLTELDDSGVLKSGGAWKIEVRKSDD